MKSRILMFVPFYPPHTGGVEYYAEELGKVLGEDGFEITVLAPQIPASAPTDETFSKIRVLRYPAFEIIHNFPIPKFWRKEYGLLMKEICAQSFGTVISHTRFFVSSFLALRYARKKYLPLIHIEHGSSFVQSDNPFISLVAWIYDHLVGKYLFHRSALVIAVSESVRNFIKVLAPKTKTTTIYRGFEAEKIESIPVNEEIWKSFQDSKRLRLVFVGRLFASKGVHELIHALALLPSTEWTCILIGDGPEKENIKSKIASLNLKKNAFLLGHKSWSETIAILKGADILINPSHTEGLPTTVLEAALCGIPIIATDVGGTREISPSITFIPAKDPTALAKAISTVSGKIDEIASSGRLEIQDIKEKFSWETARSKFSKIIRSLNG